MLMLDFKNIHWWNWLVSASLIVAGLSGWQDAFFYVIALNLINLIYCYQCEKKISAFPVQVRISFLVLLLIAYPEPMRGIYWVPGIGLWAQVIFGYCGMARFMALMPWNKAEPYSVSLLKETFLSLPVKGSVMQKVVKES